jgi:pyrroloquinoline quinone biosynthesis protein B
MGRLTAIVLGSAAGGAFPQWNCRCPVCALAWAGDKRVRARTQAGLAVSAGNSRWTLINASPDLGAQIRSTPVLHPQAGKPDQDLRGSPIDAVVLTGAEIDQIAGLLSLRESTPFTLLATPASHAAVAANAMFGALSAMTRRAVNPGERFMLAGDIEASLFMVPGKLPLYLEGDDPETNAESAANVGIELQHEGARLVFVPGAAAVTGAMRERFARADAVLFDGTLFTDDEMLRSGTGQKTGRRMGHMPIDGEGGTLQALDGLAARRIFVHINNTNPILIDGSAERRKVEAAGWQVAEDGMEIVL